MKQDNLGRCILNEQDALELLYKGKSIDNIYAEQQVIDQYNKSVIDNEIDLEKLKSIVDIDIETFDQQNQSNWYMPLEYKNMDIVEYVLSKTQNEQQKQRVLQELEMFVERGMENVLKFMVYLVDTMRKNNIVWGVGRGSSVSSYVLYLIGIHKVDSIKFNLDIKEFLR
jgi:DNA polymerase III alpha subunit